MFLTLPVFRGIIRYVIRSHAILHEIISFPLWTVPYRTFARRTCAKAPLPTNGAYRRASFCCPRSNFNWQPDSYPCLAWWTQFFRQNKNIHWDRYIKYRYIYNYNHNRLDLEMQSYVDWQACFEASILWDFARHVDGKMFKVQEFRMSQVPWLNYPPAN